jgi:hypothetical protein
MGVDMVTLANNHGADYGAGLARKHATAPGGGRSLCGRRKQPERARAATLVTTPKGRVTVVAAAARSRMLFGRRWAPGVTLTVRVSVWCVPPRSTGSRRGRWRCCSS